MGVEGPQAMEGEFSREVRDGDVSGNLQNSVFCVFSETDFFIWAYLDFCEYATLSIMTGEAMGYTRAQMLSFSDKESNNPLHAAVNSGDLKVSLAKRMSEKFKSKWKQLLKNHTYMTQHLWTCGQSTPTLYECEAW